MRKMLLFLAGIGAVVALIYLGSKQMSGSQAPSAGSALKSGGKDIVSSGQILGASVAKSVLGGVDNLVAQAESAVRKGAANLVQGVSQNATNQITQAILGSSTPAAAPEQIQANSTPAQEVSVCSSYAKNQTISYILKFSSVSSQVYSVDWGDGETSSGAAIAAETPVMHSYASSGSYIVTFKSGTFTAQKNICVR